MKMAMFDLDKDGPCAVEPSHEVNRRFKQKEHNDRQKKFAKTIGENFATFGLLAVMVLMVSSIWAEFGIFTNWTKFAGEALTTVVLYILADIYATSLGVIGGKLDDDYIKCHNEYLNLRKEVRTAGVALMEVFCDWQIDVEYEYYLRRRCKELKIDYKEFCDQYHGKTLEELKEMFPIEQIKKKNFWQKIFGTVRNAKTSSKAAKIFALNQIKHIVLTPEILMTDGKVRDDRGGVSEGGEEHVEKHTTGAPHIIKTALFGICAAIPVINLMRDFSVALLIYTIFKIALMLYRMYSGYSRGAKAYNTIEPKHLQDKIKYLYLYIEFLNKKIYLTLEDKYGSIVLSFEKENSGK